MTTSTLSRRVMTLLIVVSLLISGLAPLLTSRRVHAEQLVERSIRISTSVVGATGATYNIQFKPKTVTSSAADDIKGIVLEFCQDSPLIGTNCNTTNGVSQLPAAASTVNVTSGANPSVAFTVDASSTANKLVLTSLTGIAAPAAADFITFSFTARNPTGTASTASAPGPFFGRLLTYNSDTTPASYTSTAPGTHLDDGGLALSTARQLQVTARVQEQLEFCVGALPGNIDGKLDADTQQNDYAEITYTSCANFPTETTVTLGVVDSTTTSVTPIAGMDAGYDRNGGIFIRTNAAYGVVISYFPEQETSSGQLKVPGAACTGTSTQAGNASAVSTDQCFNSGYSGSDTDDTRTDFSTAGEKFGMTVSNATRPASSTTNALIRDVDYGGDGGLAPGTGGGFEWYDTAVTGTTPAPRIAYSNGVLDYEMLVIRFAARSAATTPTGAYSVTTTYVATSTF